MGGLARVTRAVFRDLDCNTRVRFEISESMVMLAVLHVGFLILCEKERGAWPSTLPSLYMESGWFRTKLDNLKGRTIPKFLADWATMMGAFAGPGGRQYCLKVPEILSGANPAFAFDDKYATSFPIFRLLTRVIRNELEGRAWNTFQEDPTQPVTAANPLLVSAADVPKFPGLANAPRAVSPPCRDGFADNYVGSIEYLPAAGTAPTLRHYLQIQPPTSMFDERFVTGIFDTLDTMGMPCVTIDDHILKEEGNGALAYYVVPDAGLPPTVFSIHTLLAEHDPELADYAGFFQPIICKPPGHCANEAERAAGRWPTSRVNETLHAQPSWAYSTYIEEWAADYAGRHIS
jgi:hypothetical protein